MFVRSWPLISWVLFSGCSSPPAAAPPEEGGGTVVDPLLQLERDTGHRWTIRYHDDLQTPAFLEGQTPPLAATTRDAERAGKAFLGQYRQIFSMAAPDEELAAGGAETDELGFLHARFRQMKGKIPVWGGELKVHFDPSGALVRIHGRYLPFSTTTLSPTISPDTARVAAAGAAKQWAAAADVDSFSTLTPTLYHFPRSNADVRLAFRVEVSSSDSQSPARLEVFIDALDGSVLAVHDLFRYLEGSGIGFFGEERRLEIAERSGHYYLEDTTRAETALKTYTAAGDRRLPGSEVRSADPAQWDEEGPAPGAAVDAHAHLAAVWDYFAQIHGRRGWDGQGTGVRATVHFGTRSRAAFFDGKGLVFGDGDGEMAPAAAALDLVAHEFTHGLLKATSGLGGEGPSGAVAEALCDLFACFAAQRAGVGDWQVGKTVYRPSGTPRALRDLANPHETGHPDHLDEYQSDGDDDVHRNSTIVSHAGYLMAEDGVLGPVAPAALGRTRTERVWFRALAYYLTAQADLADAADAVLVAARDLGEREDVIQAAFAAVGIRP